MSAAVKGTKAPDAGPVKVADQQKAPAREPAAVAPDAPDIRPGVAVGGRPVSELSKDEILALLEARRQQFNEVAKVAKEKGVKVETKKKTAADSERLMEFWNRVGYHTGMVQWARGRREEVLKRALAVVANLGEGWDPEMQGDAVEAMVEGFREARIQTSFKSSSMPEKKVADKVPGSEVLKELAPLVRGISGELDELLPATAQAGSGN